ncbi:MAG: hypothetical protein Hyperionvirus24_33 [Hyperionvirus sp.]|uniref:Uncharacterized protein n=1 Tax=Hyperionvirus sp. TaxID=2487770 RepID=A0A3G5ADR7_9VIRU|nr:MAG: hypothetical protein Hyperionvirus24_33 [Hyperionvirus sp.]
MGLDPASEPGTSPKQNDYQYLKIIFLVSLPLFLSACIYKLTLPQENLTIEMMDNIIEWINPDHLETFVQKIADYHQINQKYPPNLEYKDILNSFFRRKIYNPEYVEKMLTTLEKYMGPIDKIPTINNFFLHPYFHFNHAEENNHYPYANSPKIKCIMAFANRISGTNHELAIVNELLTHEPRQFLFDLIIKYSKSKRFQLRLFVKYAIKLEWVESMNANQLIIPQYLDDFLKKLTEADKPLEHFTDNFVDALLRIDDNPSRHRGFSLKLVNHYIIHFSSLTPVTNNKIFTLITKIAYKFTDQEIQKIAFDLFNSGATASPGWNELKKNHPDFWRYFKKLNS